MTPYDVARKFLGVKEIPGATDNPWIKAWLAFAESAHVTTPAHLADEVPWCAAFVYFCAEMAGAKSIPGLRARFWLTAGKVVSLNEARSGWDVCIFKRGPEPQPGIETVDAPGHVAFFDRMENGNVRVLGGNQGDAVSFSTFHVESLLGVRRLL